MSGLALCVSYYTGSIIYHMAGSTSGDVKQEGHTPKLEGSTELRANICCVTRLIRERPLIFIILLLVLMIVL